MSDFKDQQRLLAQERRRESEELQRQKELKTLGWTETNNEWKPPFKAFITGKLCSQDALKLHKILEEWK